MLRLCFLALAAVLPQAFAARVRNHNTPDPDAVGAVPLEDSNMADQGSKEHHDLRRKAAESEEAWKDCGQKAGVEVWRVEGWKVVPLEKSKGKLGEFHKNDSYIILDTTKDRQGRLHRKIHFWLGAETSIDKRGIAAYKTVELGDLFHGAPSQHREVMGYESEAFQKLFPKAIMYLEGGTASAFKHVKPEEYVPRLLQVRQTKQKLMRVTELPLTIESFNHEDCFIVDAGLSIYPWFGDHANPHVKYKAALVANAIKAERFGRAKVYYQYGQELWGLVGRGNIKLSVTGEESAAAGDLTNYKIKDNADENEMELDLAFAVEEPVLFKLGCKDSDAPGLPDCDFAEVAKGSAIDKSLLDPADVLMLMAGPESAELLLWAGLEAPRMARLGSFGTAMKYVQENVMPDGTPVIMFKQGQEIKNKNWLAVFGA